MHRIIPNLITSGSVESVFDDVNFDDPDFLYIQCKFLFILNGLKLCSRSLHLKDRLHMHPAKPMQVKQTLAMHMPHLHSAYL